MGLLRSLPLLHSPPMLVCCSLEHCLSSFSWDTRGPGQWASVLYVTGGTGSGAIQFSVLFWIQMGRSPLWPSALAKAFSEMPILRPILAAESLPPGWPNVTQWYHTVAAGSCGDRDGKKAMSFYSSDSLLLHIHSGYFKATKGDLVSECKLRAEKGCHYSLKP